MTKGLFATYHPAVCMLFFLAAIGFSFSTQHPVYVALSCILSGTFLIYLRGWRTFLRTMGTCIPLVAFVGLLNSLFNAAGATILWQWGPFSVCAEACTTAWRWAECSLRCCSGLRATTRS